VCGWRGDGTAYALETRADKEGVTSAAVRVANGERLLAPSPAAPAPASEPATSDPDDADVIAAEAAAPAAARGASEGEVGRAAADAAREAAASEASGPESARAATSGTAEGGVTAARTLGDPSGDRLDALGCADVVDAAAAAAARWRTCAGGDCPSGNTCVSRANNRGASPIQGFLTGPRSASESSRLDVQKTAPCPLRFLHLVQSFATCPCPFPSSWTLPGGTPCLQEGFPRAMNPPSWRRRRSVTAAASRTPPGARCRYGAAPPMGWQGAAWKAPRRALCRA